MRSRMRALICLMFAAGIGLGARGAAAENWVAVAADGSYDADSVFRDKETGFVVARVGVKPGIGGLAGVGEPTLIANMYAFDCSGNQIFELGETSAEGRFHVIPDWRSTAAPFGYDIEATTAGPQSPCK